MNHLASDGQDHQKQSWAQPTREEMIREIEDLILSPYWQQLHPRLRGHWLNQLGELQRHH